MTFLCREEQSDKFDQCKASVLRWLGSTEARLDDLEPVAIDIEIIEKQIEEIEVINVVFCFISNKYLILGLQRSVLKSMYTILAKIRKSDL